MGRRARWVFTDYLMRDGVKDSASGSVLCRLWTAC